MQKIPTNFEIIERDHLRPYIDDYIKALLFNNKDVLHVNIESSIWFGTFGKVFLTIKKANPDESIKEISIEKVVYPHELFPSIKKDDKDENQI